MPTCIWCLAENAEPSLEHIIPEALGCPPDFVLQDGVVCKACNNNLAHLDRAVIDDFDMQAYLANVRRKRGRPAVVRGRGNLVATRGSNGPEISINMDCQAVLAHDGSPLGAFGKSKRNVKATLSRRGKIGKVCFSTVFGEDPKFARGITKIAFSSFAYFMGPEMALPEKFNAVRAFVCDGIGQRPILMTAGEDPRYSNRAWPPYQSENGEYVVPLRLATAEFLIDLSPALSSSALFEAELAKTTESKNWTWIPAQPRKGQ